MRTFVGPKLASTETFSNPPQKRWHVGSLSYTTGELFILFCWLLWGDFAWSMKDRSVPSVLQLLFKQFDASDMVTGLLIGSLPGIISMILGPIISYKSDRHRGRWGRRIPFLLIPTPIAVLTMVGLAFSPWIGGCFDKLLGSHSLGLNTSVLIFLGLFWTLFEFASITANSVFGGLVNDVVPQAVIGRFYGLFRALCLIAGIVFNLWMFGKAETHYVWIFLGVGALYGIGFMIMCLKVKEGEYPPPSSTVEEGGSLGFFSACRTYFKECFGNSYYVWFFAAMAVAGIAFAPVNLFSVFYAGSIGMSIADYGKYLAITYTISLALAYPMGSMADRFHPLRLSIMALGLYVLICLWSGFYARDTWTFGLALVAHGVCSGIFFTASASIGQRLLPRARFAELGSAAGIVGCFASIVIAPTTGLFLDYAHHVYRYTFFAGSGLALLALLLCFVLHRKFMMLGGPENYVAPE